MILNTNTQIQGYVEILNKDKKIIYESNNTILPFGKYKLLSSLFTTKNEQVDGIKYLELYHSSDEDLTEIRNYNILNRIKSIQINRRENINLMQYDNNSLKWDLLGNILRKYKYDEKEYRGKYLLERFSNPINDFHIFTSLFTIEEQCMRYNKIQIQFSIPVIKPYQSNPFHFNLLVLTYGGQDIGKNEYGEVLTDNFNHEVLDTNINNSLSPETLTWGSGLPFSQINLPETFEVLDQIYINWKFIFNFNTLI